MAEFCLDCWNKLNGTHYTPDQVWLEEDLCEGCGAWKPVVVDIRGEEKKNLTVRDLLLHPYEAKVEDLMEIVKLGVMTAPSLMKDGKLIISGQVVSTDKIVKLLQK